MAGANQGRVLVAASILAADFACLGEQVAEAVAAGCDWIHVDVMDGHFVPNISIGLPVVTSLRRVTTLPFDVHLMIAAPERYIDAFVAAGADHLTVHIETCPRPDETIARIRAAGARAGITLKPATPLSALTEVLPLVDLVLVMSVQPGFGGQPFQPASLERIAALRRQLTERGLTADLAVDGGITRHNAGAVARAGANVLVAGSAIFSPDFTVADGVTALRRAIEH
jgi:ribulose-phosphate 3-epimerase